MEVSANRELPKGKLNYKLVFRNGQAADIREGCPQFTCWKVLSDQCCLAKVRS
jgi:hypothetical protein